MPPDTFGHACRRIRDSTNIAILRVTGYSLTFLFIGVPAVYYTYVEVVRSSEIRKRRGRYLKAHSKRESKRLAAAAAAAASTEDTSLSKFENVHDGTAQIDAEEMNEVKIAFGSYVAGMRWSNPFPEWREQGAWEWLFWKGVWQPLTGKIWWNGGLPDSAELLAISLPVETPDFVKLFGSQSSSVRQSESLKRSPSREVRGLEESWDHLSNPSLTPPRVEGAESDEETSLIMEAHGGSDVKASQDLTFTWIGQSTAFIQIDGIGILTDPVFAYRTIDNPLAPPRLRPPPCPLASLAPGIQVVLVSHDHFDHIHPADVQELGDKVQWIVPLGLAKYIRLWGASRITELDWWQTTVVRVDVPNGRNREEKTLEVTATPAMHWSARTPLDTNQSLWCSFVVRGQKETFFHSGDTGYTGEVFKAIGRVFGPITLAILPIGAYLPRWHLASQHCNPEDAVKIHLDIKSKYSIGVHWGTWILSDEHYLDPPKDLAIARKKYAISEEAFRVVPPGRTLVL